MQTAINKDILASVKLAPIWQQVPFGCQVIKIEEGHRPQGFRFAKHIINVAARLNGSEFVVCGQDDRRDVAEAKAFSELIERSALIRFGEGLGAKTSNGWAAHPHEQSAKNNAILELVERDAVLAQWYSKVPFVEVEPTELPKEIRQWVADELSRSEFPKLVILLASRGIGPAVTCLFINEKRFGVSSHAAKTTLIESIKSAITEATRAAHATIRREHWNDTLKLKNREPGPVDPGAHSVYYAYHEPFPQWMFGRRISWVEADRLWQMQIDDMVDDCPIYHSVLTEPLHVGYAKHSQAFELQWGTTIVELVAETNGAKRWDLKPETINSEPHIVS